MNGKILFVDDEPEVLKGYKRILRGDFHLSTALSGEDALAEIRKKGPYEVVVSDMKMPGMNGIQLLSQVREIAPQTIRVVLTGHADIETAMTAVNEDAVFRFLTKPCPAGVLKKTLTACLMQYQLVTAEKELLENTLMGAIKVLTDVLSLASPAAFGRSVRINRCVQHMVRELQLETPWRYEAAAMLSQLGLYYLRTRAPGSGVLCKDNASRGAGPLQYASCRCPRPAGKHPQTGRHCLDRWPATRGRLCR